MVFLWRMPAASFPASFIPALESATAASKEIMRTVENTREIIILIFNNPSLIVFSNDHMFV